jgi:hypothetical protein
MLDYVAVFVIFFLMIAAIATILLFGSLPGMIARKRGYPWPDAIEAASWIGHIFVVFYPVAWDWAFLAFSAPGTGHASDAPVARGDLARLRARLARLEWAVARLPTQSENDTP